ncbi:MAG: hypothetical protein FJZ04_03380 [Candidatus Moranbacteria bacterium]|nr:hypothetical protein [Candidatus Moranbacteria bacterium]
MSNICRALIVLAGAIGIVGIVYSWPVFLLIILTILAALLAWLYLPKILIILPALIPFLPALNPTADIDLAFGRLMIVFLAIVGCIYIVYTKCPWFDLSTPTLLIMFFLFWSFFSGLSADDPGRFIRKYLVFLTIFPIYFLALAFLCRKDQWHKLFKYWSWSAFLASILALGQFLSQFVIGREAFISYWGKYVAPLLFGANAGEAVASNPSWLVNVGGIDVLRAFGVFPDPHMLAFFLGMSLPLQMAYVLEKNSDPRFRGNSGGAKKIFLWILPFLSFLALLLTFSRGSYVGFLGAVLWLVYYLWRENQLKVSPRGIFYVLLGVLAVNWIVFSVTPVRERFLSILDFNEGSNKGRLEIWSEAVEVTKYNPILGVGMGNYASFVRPESKYREPIYAHNTYLDLAGETGIPGALAWALVLLWAVRPLFGFYCLGRGGCAGDNNSNILSLAAALGIFWFSLHSFFETPVFSPQILPLVLVLIAYQAFNRKANFKI